ncbi:MAG: methyltransferase domain-containing protein [Acidobacteriia bacterium]|nr:methyltransferase domain-containing protein [Terriglobia bacterium]
MQRVDTPEILDSDACPPAEVEASLRDLGRINRWFGGVATSRALIEQVVRVTGRKNLSLLEVAAGFGEVPHLVARKMATQGVTLDITLLDRAKTHLINGTRSVVGDALAIPFADGAFDLISCNLFVHHLDPESVCRFTKEALRVSRCAVLINDLIRHPLHLALVYAGFPLMRSHVSRVDGVASVRRAYVSEEIREILAPALASDQRIEISRHYLFRMGVTVWKA